MRANRLLGMLTVIAALTAGYGGGAVRSVSAADETPADLDRLEADIVAAEDLSAIKKVNRAYGYYTDKGLWDDLADLFAEQGLGYYGGGIYVGRESLRQHFLKNLGGGRIGLVEGRMYNHTILQPVVHLDPGGVTAKGRWRTIAMLGRLGGTASWAGGIYENTYVKERGDWKFASVRYHSAFGGPYVGGWSTPRTAGPIAGGRGSSAHPPDRPSDPDCPGYPTACITAFHYANPSTPSGGSAWTSTSLPVPPPSKLAGAARLASLAARVERLTDEQAIENLQRIYGYYIDRAHWDHAADLFDADGTIEVGQAGVYVGPRRIRDYLALAGPQGLRDGWLNDHLQLQPIVTVAADGMTARGYSRELAMTGELGGKGLWGEGTYDNLYVKTNGVWRIKSLHLYTNAIFDYDKGWGNDAQPAPSVSATLAPDRPPTTVYASYPKMIIAPLSFTNPATGKPPHYPNDIVIGKPTPAPKVAAARRSPATVVQVREQLGRVKDVVELENLQSAYGYYVDKNLWNDVADLMARDSTYELAQRGVYVGQDSIRKFLLGVFGKEGPVENRLGEHMSLQPVIHVAPGGTTANIRVRLIQMMGTYGQSAGWGAGVYENAAVKENGVWKYSKVHAYNTFTANYQGGWAKSPGRGAPGPSRTTPPDRPPSEVFQMFPTIYQFPYHYKNPVTGK